MNCPNCGAMMRQGPSGGWACGNCGTVRPTSGPVLSACGQCHAEVVDGPEGGYCCGACGHVEEPPARVRARRGRGAA